MEIDEFRKTYAKLKVKIDAMPTDRALESLELFLDIHRYQLPAFYTNHLVICEFGKGIINYKGRCYRKPSTIEITPHKEIYIEPCQCVGAAWLFRNDRTEGHPKPEKLSRCLYLPPETAPPIDPDKIGDYYYCGDGCHRIYAAYLLGRKVKTCIYDVWREETHTLPTKK